MILEDKNKSWTPPERYTLFDVHVDGSYLRVEYRQPVFWAGTTVVKSENVITIYLNDMGREVARSSEGRDCQLTLNKTPQFVPVSRWSRFYNGWLIVLQGFQEIWKYLW